jgi:hypothetical protein
VAKFLHAQSYFELAAAGAPTGRPMTAPFVWRVARRIYIGGVQLLVADRFHVAARNEYRAAEDRSDAQRALRTHLRGTVSAPRVADRLSDDCRASTEEGQVTGAARSALVISTRLSPPRPRLGEGGDLAGLVGIADGSAFSLSLAGYGEARRALVQESSARVPRSRERGRIA